MEIRVAKEDDFKSIFDIRMQTDDILEKDLIKSEIINPNYLVLVSVDKGTIVGFLSIIKNYDCADVMMIATDINFRRRGVAERLLIDAMEILKKQGVKKLMLEVKEGNISAIKLYKKLGFLQISIRKKYYMGQYDAIILERAL